MEMFYLTMHSTHIMFSVIYRHMVKGYSYSEKGTPHPPLYGLFFPISSKGYFICIIPQAGWYISSPLLEQLWSTGWNEN